MPKTKVKKVVKKKKPVPKYKLEVSVNDTVFSVKTNDFYKSLKEFIESSDYPVGVKTKVFFKYGDKDRTIIKLYATGQARRLFRMMKVKDDAVVKLASQLTSALV